MLFLLVDAYLYCKGYVRTIEALTELVKGVVVQSYIYGQQIWYCKVYA